MVRIHFKDGREIKIEDGSTREDIMPWLIKQDKWLVCTRTMVCMDEVKYIEYIPQEEWEEQKRLLDSIRSKWVEDSGNWFTRLFK